MVQLPLICYYHVVILYGTTLPNMFLSYVIFMAQLPLMCYYHTVILYGTASPNMLLSYCYSLWYNFP